MDLETNTIFKELNGLNEEDAAFRKYCSKLSEDIKNERATIVSLVELLQPFLIDPDWHKRRKGTYVLSEILKDLPHDFLSNTQLNFIFMFYCDRLKDHHEVIPSVLKGISALIKCKNIPEGVVTQFFTALFQNISCQQQQQQDRQLIYDIFKVTWSNQQNELKAMSYDFVYGILSSIEGERDPRNLYLLFTWLPTFLKEVELGHLVTEMFEVLACYFPVDFRPGVQDPNNISRDDLSHALLACLCAIPAFSESCFELALNTLSASQKMSKLESLKLLIESCKTFPETEYVKQSNLLDEIQKEILTAKDEETTTVALETLSAIIQKLSNLPEPIFAPIVQNVCDTAQGNLLPEAKLYDNSIKIFISLTKASKTSSNIIAQKILPIITNIYNITTTPTYRAKILGNLTELLVTYIKINKIYQLESQELLIIPIFCLEATTNQDEVVQATSFNSLSLLVQYLPSETKSFLYKNLNQVLVQYQNETVRKAVLNCLRSSAESFPDEVNKNIIIPIKSENNKNMFLYLNSLAFIADLKFFTETVLVEIGTSCIKNNTSQISFKVLYNLLQQNHTDKFCVVLNKLDFVNKVIKFILETSDVVKVDDEDSLKNIAGILKELVGFSENKQKRIIEENLVKILDQIKQNAALVALLDGLVCRLRIGVDIKGVFDVLLDISIQNTNEYVHATSMQLLGNVLNKTTDEETLNNYLGKVNLECDKYLNKIVSDTKQFNNFIDVIFFVAKALAMRDHKNAELFMNKLLQFVNKHESAAKGFTILMCDKYDSFDTKSYCIKRLLYRQKLFMQLIKKLLKLYDDQNINYLIAFGYLMKETPQQILKLNFKDVIRPIILCMDLINNADVLLAILNNLCSLIATNEPLAEEYIQEFVPRFLKLTKFKQSMKVRMNALQCLKYYSTGFPVYKLLPLKVDVIYGLAEALDDPKRLVRREAVEARSCWFMIDAPQ